MLHNPHLHSQGRNDQDEHSIGGIAYGSKEECEAAAKVLKKDFLFQNAKAYKNRKDTKGDYVVTWGGRIANEYILTYYSEISEALKKDFV